jgi:ubiquinone/menaquinone biosynthesis C-methylase UbiE
MKDKFFFDSLIDPLSKEGVKAINKDLISFKCSNNYPVINNIPIIIDESRSIFEIGDILKNIPTTQSSSFRDKSLKNTVRKNILPSLSIDFTYEKRYSELAERFKGKNILVIGCGDKIALYNKIFKDSLVINSDVHVQFSPDIVFDSHQIPFKDESFDLIIAAQVLEHTFKPWIVAEELERTIKTGGNLLIEVPFNFPYHSPPYDFFRFTFTGLRSLFPKSNLVKYEVPEGNASSVANYNSDFLINLFANRYLRMVMLFISRFLFGWLKYIDLLRKKESIRSISIPKGFSMIFEKDNIERSNIQLLDEYFELKKASV